MQLWVSLVTSRDAIVVGEKLWLGGKVATKTIPTTDRLAQKEYLTNTPLTSSILLTYNTDLKIRYL
jgi:hypothetical protein